MYRLFIHALQGESGDSTEGERTPEDPGGGGKRSPHIHLSSLSPSLPNTAPSSGTNDIAPYRLTELPIIRDLRPRPRLVVYVFATQWCLFSSFAV